MPSNSLKLLLILGACASAVCRKIYRQGCSEYPKGDDGMIMRNLRPEVEAG
jgi:hypothetical protein